jgi:hypothetical protein
MKFDRKLVKTYRTHEMCYRDHLDRAQPTPYVRFAEVNVYRLPWDFLGLFDNHVELWGDWKELADSIFGKDRPRFSRIFAEVLAKDMDSRGLK